MASFFELQRTDIKKHKEANTEKYKKKEKQKKQKKRQSKSYNSNMLAKSDKNLVFLKNNLDNNL